MFQAGYDKNAIWTVDGGSPVSLCITGWDTEDGGDTPEVTSTCHGGQQAFLAGIRRAPCSFTANFDNAQTPASVGLTFGRKGTLSFVTGAGNPDSVHVIIEKVARKSVVNGVVSFTVTAKSDALNASGNVVSSVNFS